MKAQIPDAHCSNPASALDSGVLYMISAAALLSLSARHEVLLESPLLSVSLKPRKLLEDKGRPRAGAL